MRIALQILIPLVLVLTSVRLLLTNSFVRFNYSLPGFPQDRHGFTLEDRLHLAPIALEYLLNDEGVEFLGDQRFDDGSTVYNTRELGHMEDVKGVTKSAIVVWRVGLVLTVVLGAVIWRIVGVEQLLLSLQAGAKLTAVLMLVLIVLLIVGFSFLFVGFHQIFFDPNTWIFPFEDTLIRLFPERFWQVTIATVGAATLVQAGVMYLIARTFLARSG